MRGRDMHPLCCISVDFAGIGGRSPPPPQTQQQQSDAELAAPADPPPGAASPAVAGVLYKWTNIGKGWRRRWFSLGNGVLTYSKIRPREQQQPPPQAAAFEGEGVGVRLIGASAAARLSRPGTGDRKPRKPARVVKLKISSYRESKSDDRKFYVFSPTKTLHLRTDSSVDRVAWLEALSLATNEFSFNGGIPCVQDVSFSTDRLRERMQAEGVDEILIRDCEQIMHSEFSEYHRQLKLRYDEHLSFLGTFQQQFEAVDGADIDITTTEGQLQLKHEYSGTGQETYHDYSTTESSDDIEKQELDELSDEDELAFFDTKENFGDYLNISATQKLSAGSIMSSEDQVHSGDVHSRDVDPKVKEQKTFPHVKRRMKLPDPIEKEKSVSLWSMIKDNVGKDLTRVCLPVYFNEPLSSLQKCFEDLEYSHLLDQAYEYGKQGNNLMRMVNVAAFAVSGYASCDGRLCKPFNPLLGETYEADYPEKGIRFFAEKVSHHPMLIACHCEGKGWKFWGDSNLKNKFWGQSIQLDPIGVLTLEFDDGEVFQWNKVTTTIYNLIIGKVYINHHGLMNIRGNRQYSCKLKFKEHSFLERNPRQVQGFVEDVNGKKVATLTGKWDDSMYYTLDTEISRNRNSYHPQNTTLLWKRNKPPPNPTRYNLTSFAITLNELTKELQEQLPPTDSRLRPDQHYLENGEYEKANAEKLRLEQRQRMSRKFQENGWKPKWFEKDSDNGTFRYVGGYWEAREHKKWDDCMDIFSDFSDQSNIVHCA